MMKLNSILMNLGIIFLMFIQINHITCWRTSLLFDRVALKLSARSAPTVFSGVTALMSKGRAEKLAQRVSV